MAKDEKAEKTLSEAQQSEDEKFEEFLSKTPEELREPLREIKKRSDAFNTKLEATFPDREDKAMVEVTCTQLLTLRALRLSGANVASMMEDRVARSIVAMLSIYTKEDQGKAATIWDMAKEMSEVVLVEVEKRREKTRDEIKEAVAEVVEKFFDQIKKELSEQEHEDKHESRGKRGKPDPKKLH